MEFNVMEFNDYIIIYSDCGRNIIDKIQDDGQLNFAPYIGADYIVRYIVFNKLNMRQYNNSDASDLMHHGKMCQKIKLVCWGFECAEIDESKIDRSLIIKFKTKNGDI